jgi:gas vesicle protein
MEKDLRGAEVRGKSIDEDLESKYESAKGAARDSVKYARDSTEKLYQESRSSAEHKAHEVREAAEKKAAEAKQGWFSWLGWGRGKVDQGKDKVASEADRLQREAEKR